jgi:hypothetical protein
VAAPLASRNLLARRGAACLTLLGQYLPRSRDWDRFGVPQNAQSRFRPRPAGYAVACCWAALGADPLGRDPPTVRSLAVTLGVHRNHRHRARIPIGHHVGGRGRVFLETLSVAMAASAVVVHLKEEHVVWTIGHHEELAAARLLDGIGGGAIGECAEQDRGGAARRSSTRSVRHHRDAGPAGDTDDTRGGQ